jgi:hypothetical protein
MSGHSVPIGWPSNVPAVSIEIEGTLVLVRELHTEQYPRIRRSLARRNSLGTRGHVLAES